MLVIMLLLPPLSRKHKNMERQFTLTENEVKEAIRFWLNDGYSGRDIFRVSLICNSSNEFSATAVCDVDKSDLE